MTEYQAGFSLNKRNELHRAYTFYLQTIDCLLPKARGVSARGNIRHPLFEFSYFKLDRSVNVESRLASNFFDEYCYRNRSERRDRVEPFSFKVAQLKFEKCSHRFVFVRYLNLSRSELLFTPLWKQTAQSVDFNASKNSQSAEKLSIIIEIK